MERVHLDSALQKWASAHFNTRAAQRSKQSCVLVARQAWSMCGKECASRVDSRVHFNGKKCTSGVDLRVHFKGEECISREDSRVHFKGEECISRVDSRVHFKGEECIPWEIVQLQIEKGCNSTGELRKR
eukprot:scaffold166927_cov20-Tisochrysis_lutea.AAC.1